MPIQKISVTSRDQWLALRKADVTASAAGALLGVYEHMSAYDLWAEKAGRLPPDRDQTKAMLRGLVFEEPAANLIIDDNPTWKLINPFVYLRDSDAKIGGTPDRWALDPARGWGTVQIKTTTRKIFREQWQDPETKIITPPMWMVIQTTIEAHLAGHEWACLAVLVFTGIGLGVDLYIIDIPLKPGVISVVKSEVAKFWAMLDKGEEPQPDYARDADTIAKVYRLGNEPQIDFAEDNRIPVLVPKIKALQAEIKARTEQLEEAKAEVKHKMGNASVASWAGGLITWNLQEKREYLQKATSFRVLRFSEKR